jgi:putative flippase GtrA
MNVPKVIQRYRPLICEFVRFSVIGIIGVVITDGGYQLLRSQLGQNPVAATSLATVAAAIASYAGNRYWSFRRREQSGVARQAPAFAVLNGIGLLIQVAVVGFNSALLGLGHDKVAEYAALNAGIALATLFRFWSYRRWVWPSRRAK